MKCQIVPVLDGGALLQKLVWIKGDVFAEIIDQTVQHVKTTYQHSNTKEVTVVFDHYGGPSTPIFDELEECKV